MPLDARSGTATSIIDKITIELVDLDLADGIAPAALPIAANAVFQLGIFGLTFDDHGAGKVVDVPGVDFGIRAVADGYFENGAEAVPTANSFGGAAYSPGGKYTGNGGCTGLGCAFELTPQTRVTIRAEARVSFDDVYSHPSDRGLAVALMYFAAMVGSDPESATYDSGYLDVDSFWSGQRSDFRAEVFQFSFSNTSVGPAAFTYRPAMMVAANQLNQPPTPVPEVSSGLLVMLGLGLVALNRSAARWHARNCRLGLAD